ncbi:Fidgetin-like protein 1 [Phytophthora citrophthora]|uniref:Fidgetin-like protein 1 n=1 Tax=Phytophthora citrophthora TaxID=4793 RepID=A0AAD9LB43_9STRA|nr:Fidgetin-like protein 1 [Phytophthora citrophthora]
MKRKLDEANERADQTERDRVIAYKTNAFMIMNHKKNVSNLQNELLQKQKELEKLIQKLRENDVGVMGTKLKKTEEDLKDMETKYAVSKRFVENMKKEMEDDAMKNEKTMEETKIKNEKTIAALKKQVEDMEEEKDEEYAALKKKLRIAKFRAEIDDELIHKAYIKIGALERKLITAKANEKNDESKTEEPKATDPLKGCSQVLISRIESDTIETSGVTMEDIAGLEFVKRCINELIVWPMSRPDSSTGLRALPCYYLVRLERAKR